jgi:hypothetical protein
MLYAEPSNTNWLGNQIELPSFTAVKLQSQVAVGHSKTMLFKIALSVLVVIGSSSPLCRYKTKLIPRATIDYYPRFP